MKELISYSYIEIGVFFRVTPLLRSGALSPPFRYKQKHHIVRKFIVKKVPIFFFSHKQKTISQSPTLVNVNLTKVQSNKNYYDFSNCT
jgi:hypothetical protein